MQAHAIAGVALLNCRFGNKEVKECAEDRSETSTHGESTINKERQHMIDSSKKAEL